MRDIIQDLVDLKERLRDAEETLSKDKELRQEEETIEGEDKRISLALEQHNHSNFLPTEEIVDELGRILNRYCRSLIEVQNPNMEAAIAAMKAHPEVHFVLHSDDRMINPVHIIDWKKIEIGGKVALYTKPERRERRKDKSLPDRIGAILGEIAPHLGKEVEIPYRSLTADEVIKTGRRCGGVYIGNQEDVETLSATPYLFKVVVKDGLGLHARPKAMIVQKLMKYGGAATYINNEGEEFNMKSIMDFLPSVAEHGKKIKIRMQGGYLREYSQAIRDIVGASSQKDKK